MYLITYSNIVSSDRILLEKASLAQPYHVIDDRVYGEFIIDMSRLYDMADGDSLNEVNSDREVDVNAADADIDDDEVIVSRYQLCDYV